MTRIFGLLFLIVTSLSAFAQNDYYSRYEGPLRQLQRLRAKKTRFAPPVVTETPEQIYKREFLTALNAYRGNLGLSPLVHQLNLDPIAATHSQNMASGSVPFSHDGFEGRCSAAYQLVSGESGCSENVMFGENSPTLALQRFLASDGHRRNIEHPSARATGIGLARSANGTLYFTQLFIMQDYL